MALGAMPCRHPSIPDTYDTVIREAVETHWPAHARFAWCMLKAQLYAESRLDPSVTSHVGAQGIGQIMPATWAESARALGISCSPYDAECSIEVAAYYSGKLLRVFHTERSWLDYVTHEFISYNAGLGNDLKGQRIAKSEDSAKVLAVLHKVTGRHATETRTYVKRINRYFVMLITGVSV